MWRYKSILRIMRTVERYRRVGGRRRKGDLNDVVVGFMHVLEDGMFIDVTIRNTHLATFYYITL